MFQENGTESTEKSLSPKSKGDLDFPDGVKLTKVGMAFRDDLPHYAWRKMAPLFRLAHDDLERKSTRIAFALGDWINFGDSKYGEKYAQAVAETGFSEGHLADVASIARKFESSVRTELLHLQHYRTVRALPEEDRRLLLSKALVADEAGNKRVMPVHQFTELVKEYKLNLQQIEAAALAAQLSLEAEAVQPAPEAQIEQELPAASGSNDTEVETVTITAAFVEPGASPEITSEPETAAVEAEQEENVWTDVLSSIIHEQMSNALIENDRDKSITKQFYSPLVLAGHPGDISIWPAFIAQLVKHTVDLESQLEAFWKNETKPPREKPVFSGVLGAGDKFRTPGGLVLEVIRFDGNDDPVVQGPTGKSYSMDPAELMGLEYVSGGGE